MAEDLDFASSPQASSDEQAAGPDAPQAKRLRRTRQELLDGMKPQRQWPWPLMSAFKAAKGDKTNTAAEDYETYLAMRTALDRYCAGVPEAQVIKEAKEPKEPKRSSISLKQGQLWRLLSRALEINPATGDINGYWVCKPNWSPSNPEGKTKPGQHLGKFFEDHPDIAARMCQFALGAAVTDLKGNPVPVPAHLRPNTVYKFFTFLCRQKKLSSESWPYMVDGAKTSHVGREAVRRWWKAKCFLEPTKAVWVLMSADAAALTNRDYGRNEPQAPYVNTFRLFERSQLDEHKVDAMFTLKLPMLDGLTTSLVTRRLWVLGMVECSCDLTLAASMSYRLRYDSSDVMRLLHRSVQPPGRFDLALQHEEFNYLPGAAFPYELAEFAQLAPYEICLDSDSTHLADETRAAIEQTLKCKVVNGRVGVPEKNNYIERLFKMLAPEWAILPSATGSWHGSPLRKNPEEKAESMHITWRHAEHIHDVLMRNRNVEPRPCFSGYSPLQRAQEYLKGGKVVTTSLGVFSEATLYRFLHHATGTLTHLRGHLSSPFVINCNYGRYTSRALNTEAMRNLLLGADHGVDLYVQEDARFAVAVLRAAPDVPIRVALMGPKAANPHSFEMRRLSGGLGPKVHRHFVANNIDPVWGASIALAREARKNSPEAHAVAPAISMIERARHGELHYVDLPADLREQLLKEAADIAKMEGWTDEEAEQGGDDKPKPKAAKPQPAATAKAPAAEAPEPPPAAAAAPGDDLYGWVNRSRP